MGRIRSASRVKAEEISPKKADRGQRSFIRNRRDGAAKREADSLRSLAKALGIISEKRKTTMVVTTVQMRVTRSDVPNSRAAMTAATDAAAMCVMLLAIRSVVRARSKLDAMYTAFFARRSPSSALDLIRILFIAENALSDPPKYAPSTTNRTKSRTSPITGACDGGGSAAAARISPSPAAPAAISAAIPGR